MKNDRQWVSMWKTNHGWTLINTHGRERGSRQAAQERAREYGWGAKATLMSQAEIDRLN